MLETFIKKNFLLVSNKKKIPRSFFFKHLLIINKIVLVDLNEESTTCGFETTPLLTAVKNIGQFKFLRSSN